MERYNDRLVQSELPDIDIKEEIGTDQIDQNKCFQSYEVSQIKSELPDVGIEEESTKDLSEQLNNLRNSSKEFSYLKTKDHDDRLVQSELPTIDTEEDIGTDPIDQKKCFDCNKTFSNREQLKRHMKYHKQSDRQFPCSECDKTFPMKHELLGKDYYIDGRNTIVLMTTGGEF